MQCMNWARSVGFLDVLVEACSFAAGRLRNPPVARLVSMPVCAALDETW